MTKYSIRATFNGEACSFFVSAEDKEDAIEKSQTVLPGCKVISSRKIKPMKVYSKNHISSNKRISSINR